MNRSTILRNDFAKHFIILFLSAAQHHFPIFRCCFCRPTRSSSRTFSVSQKNLTKKQQQPRHYFKVRFYPYNFCGLPAISHTETKNFAAVAILNSCFNRNCTNRTEIESKSFHHPPCSQTEFLWMVRRELSDPRTFWNISENVRVGA